MSDNSTAVETGAEQWDDPPAVDSEDNGDPRVIQFFVGLWITMILGWILGALWVVLL